MNLKFEILKLRSKSRTQKKGSFFNQKKLEEAGREKTARMRSNLSDENVDFDAYLLALCKHQTQTHTHHLPTEHFAS